MTEIKIAGIQVREISINKKDGKGREVERLVGGVGGSRAVTGVKFQRSERDGERKREGDGRVARLTMLYMKKKKYETEKEKQKEEKVRVERERGGGREREREGESEEEGERKGAISQRLRSLGGVRAENVRGRGRETET